ncbi:hypothetical protein [Bacillus sp. NEB1478]|uniref:hypothetical protein n=1 Tax=Bacillus sp. NEB1478 TaxID=3073816 RepID=UPI002873B6BA|nr:hypothetical protein [Bacillus sp. NEB1478]WNB91571.1 hypothetical protein RGB74_17000 [Bacillus sp. NEB1478]
MDRRWIVTTCIVLITICLTSIFFLIIDIVHYFNVIEIMMIKIQHAIKIIFFLIIILFFSLLILSKNI